MVFWVIEFVLINNYPPGRRKTKGVIVSNLFNVSNESVINSYTNSDQYQPATARWGGSPNGRVTVWASNGLTGGAGADTYAVDDGDVVTDFTAIDGSRLDLSSLDQ
jgi:hypothetical protein